MDIIREVKMKLNRIIISIISVTILFSLVGCGSNKEVKTKEITILAAASLSDVCSELKTKYEKEHDIKLNFSYGSSGALQTQIEEGANADLFFSASLDQMNTLSSKKLIDKDSVKKLLENKVVLITPKDSKTDIISFEDVNTDKVKMLGMGDPESVPAGKYAKQVFESLKVWKDVKKKANFGTDVRNVLNWVEAGEVDCGVVYETDAKISDKVKIVSTAKKGLCDDIIYPVGVLSSSNNKSESKDLIDFFSSEEAIKVFKDYGFYEYK